MSHNVVIHDTPQKKPYSAPTLTIYGSVEELTKGGPTASPENDKSGKGSPNRKV